MIDPVEAVSGFGAFMDAHGIPWVIGGSLASSMHGDFRATQDVDVMARIEVGHARLLEDALSSAYYVSEDAATSAVLSGGSFNLVHLSTFMKVDVFVADRSPWAVLQFERTVRKMIDGDQAGRTLPFLSPEDIVLQKLRWFRLGDEVATHQLSDVRAVLRVQGDAIDQSYLIEWARRLGVFDLLQRLQLSP
jgi:hypothetical protein